MYVLCASVAAQEHTDLLEAFMSFLSQVSLTELYVGLRAPLSSK